MDVSGLRVLLRVRTSPSQARRHNGVEDLQHVLASRGGELECILLPSLDCSENKIYRSIITCTCWSISRVHSASNFIVFPPNTLSKFCFLLIGR